MLLVWGAYIWRGLFSEVYGMQNAANDSTHRIWFYNVAVTCINYTVLHQLRIYYIYFLCVQVFDVAVNQHTVIKGLDIYERVGRGVGHDEYIPFRVNNNQLLIDGETVPFGGSVYVEFLKVSVFYFCYIFLVIKTL